MNYVDALVTVAAIVAWQLSELSFGLHDVTCGWCRVMHSLRHCEVEILLVTTMNSAFLFRHLDGMFSQVGRSRGYQGPMAVAKIFVTFNS